jgi:hypothetical protein
LCIYVPNPNIPTNASGAAVTTGPTPSVEEADVAVAVAVAVSVKEFQSTVCSDPMEVLLTLVVVPWARTYVAGR